MKKSLISFCFIFLILSSIFLSKFAVSEDFNPNIGGINPEQITNTTEKLSSDWEYISKEWKNLLLENSMIKGFDSFFQKISFVFFLLFGKEYSMSLTLLLIIALWIYFLVAIYNAMKDFSMFSKGVSFIISLGIVLIMTHIGLIELPVNFIMWVFVGQKTPLMRTLVGLIVFAVLATFLILLINFGKNYKKNKQKIKDEMNRMKLETGAKISEELGKAVSDE